MPADPPDTRAPGRPPARSAARSPARAQPGAPARAEARPAARPVNVVIRALQLLRALNRQPVSTIDTLHRHTGLPKATIVRLVQTLVADGLVQPAPQYGAYYLTGEVKALSSGYHREPRIVEAAADIADALTRSFKWPVSVAVPDGDAVIVRYSTIPLSPLSFFHSTINMRLSLLTQALGRAYLAFCDPLAQQALLDLLLAAHPDDAVPLGGAAGVRHMLQQVRAQGHALRDPRVRPESSTLALPVFEGERVVATLGLTWFSSTLTPEQAVARFRAPLQQAAGDIAQALDRLR